MKAEPGDAVKVGDMVRFRRPWGISARATVSDVGPAHLSIQWFDGTLVVHHQRIDRADVVWVQST